MHIHHLALRVRDFEKSLHFYQTLTELKIHTQFPRTAAALPTCRTPPAKPSWS